MKVFQEGMARQFLSVLTSHIITALILATVSFAFFASIMDKPAIFAAASVVLSLIYFSSLYSRGSEIAHRDKLSYTTTSAYLLKGAVLSLPVLIWNLLLWLLYIFTWSYLTIDGQFFSFSGIFYNILYVINTFMFSGLAEISKGYVEWHAHLLIYLVPITALTLGYIAGMYDFSLTEKFAPFIYEKKKK